MPLLGLLAQSMFSLPPLVRDEVRAYEPDVLASQRRYTWLRSRRGHARDSD
ncbi:hypothetical protein ACIBKX_33245 [Streptomyces sp. NPDC050658]|uniref:hypothetical protein n=1 Tax=unclassified Streptomyces TaxID=2593676 RepID=UPI003433C936